LVYVRGGKSTRIGVKLSAIYDSILFRGLKADGGAIPDGGIAADDSNEARADGGKPDEDSNEENPGERIPDGIGTDE
jgi:hypothetical protein